MLSRLKQLIKPQLSTSLDQLDYKRLPVLDADGLISLTGQQGRLRAIKRIVKIDDQRYQLLYQDVIERFAEIVQLMPASQAHHHAVPGGLFVHTLEVIEIALMMRQKYKLPLFSEQEVQEAERHIWTYAVFVAAMLHDIGKRLTLCRFVLGNGNILEPFNSDISKYLGQHYQIIFHDPKYHPLHEQLGLAFVCTLLPPVAQDFLLPRLHIMKEIMEYIHETGNDGVINKILKEADQKSTGQSLAHSAARKFPGANLENIGERLMTQLRSLIAANHFVINKANASIYTSKNGYTYIVSKLLADTLRDSLAKDGVTDIPHDNNRIFDIFGEYGFAEPNSKGQVMHYIHRVIGDSNQTLSVLKFQTSKLFRVIPEVFEGQLEEVAGRKHQSQETIMPVAAKTVVEKSYQSNSIPEAGTTQISKTGAGNDKAETASQAPEAEKPKKHKKAENSLDEAQIAADFFAWCREKIISKTIIVNENGSMIQKIQYKDKAVIGVITPRIFSEFAAEVYELEKNKATAEKMQRAIHNNKLNIKAPKGQIHAGYLKKSPHNPLGGNVKIFMYLFEQEKIYADDEQVKTIIDSIDVNSNLAIS